MKKRLLFLLLFMLLILFMTYKFEFNRVNQNKNRLFSSLIKPLIRSKNSSETKKNYYANNDSIIIASELFNQLENENVELIAVTNKAYLNRYIPDSSRILINEIITRRNNIDGLIVSQDEIEQLLSKKGIKESDTIVVYDENTSLYAARLWWTLKVYGHKDVRILNGGLKEWIKQGYETVSVPKIEQKSKYQANSKNEKMITTLQGIKDSISNKREKVVDVRTVEEYNQGHIPGAVNIVWSITLNEDGTFKSRDDLLNIYESNGITKNLDMIYTQCLKATRASHTYFVLSELLGYDNVSVYDGSWEEYSKSNLPIEK